MKNKEIMGIAMTLALTGCVAINPKENDCPLSKGIACQSMKAVDELVTQGYFTEKKSLARGASDRILKIEIIQSIKLERGHDNDSQ